MGERFAMAGLLLLGMVCIASVVGMVVVKVLSGDIPPSLSGIAGTALGGIVGGMGHYPPYQGPGKPAT